ncbi:MAG: histidine phosphatase family protein [Spirochaetales bacterium]|nr:histidine phosphatase family protein [Spirochaetales bacterium]
MHIQTLKNRYWLMRHGRSQANIAGKIISSLEEGRAQWGLAPQAMEGIQSSVESHSFSSNLVIVSSPFLRARETAETVCALVGGGGVALDENLRERWFGTLDGKEDSFYSQAWKWDESHLAQKTWDVPSPPNPSWGKDSVAESPEGVEDCLTVLQRLLLVLHGQEKRHTGASILLVSHGDPLDILLAWSQGHSPYEHRKIPGMNTAEIRPLSSRISSLY